MSDSEDDFMSDKFLVETSPPGDQPYTERRAKQSLKSQRLGQAKNQIKLKDLEVQRRREGLNKALWERDNEGGAEGSGNGGGGKALEMMMKMGWKVGEGLGKKRLPDLEDGFDLPPAPVESASRGGIGSKKKKLSLPEQDLQSGVCSSGAQPASEPRIEPLRISIWDRRKGLSARSPSPPPLKNPSNTNPDALPAEKLERLGRETAGFRERQGLEWSDKERERKGRAARERLVEFDLEKGVKFHPLHVSPSDPLDTIPHPLLKLIYPSQLPSSSRSPSPDIARPHDKSENLSAAEILREQLRRDMLSDLGKVNGEEESGELRFGVMPSTLSTTLPFDDAKSKQQSEEYEGVNWKELVSPVKRVLSMDSATYLEFVVDQLRHGHLFCFWCAYKYGSWEEIEGPGGCPGTEEEDH
ncbi:uncharacterized protein L203_105255 [Cryptococcus depauperatus CBS 7841]|uniref:Uncharacterized protein n=1 Tax=Cryptococcus depauperatus CBS 7841 TaxID=1295531 RepID=A0A1E3HYM3_9TREE|nr:hypothetical protein L203_05622 [Cryptococcus depauperatus CBS 7841]